MSRPHRLIVARLAIPVTACYLLLIDQLIGSPASSAALALLVVFCHLANAKGTQLCGLDLDLVHKIGVPRQRPLRDRKPNSDRSSTAIVLPDLRPETLVHPVLKTHWATRGHQLLLECANSLASSEVNPISFKSLLIMSCHFFRVFLVSCSSC